MQNQKLEKIQKFFKRNKYWIVAGVIIFLIALISFTSPKTLSSGNGYKHQIGSFRACEFSDCKNATTHRIHHFFGNQDFCEEHWNSYGKNMFLGLSKQEDDGLDYDKYESNCRHSGCDKKALYTDWDKRYCSEHLQGTKYCRYPGCGEKIPINGLYDYCSEHR